MCELTVSIVCRMTNDGANTAPTATMRHNHKGSLAVLGTGSDVGKSILAAGICRVLSNAGITTVAPFKGQNKSNNAYPALMFDGMNGEIGIAQAIQARACRQIPRVEVSDYCKYSVCALACSLVSLLLSLLFPV